jgi:hypothetical protein
MKRDMDLVRSLLLRVEDLNGPMMNDLMADEKDADERARVGYHIRMLVDEDFLNGDDGSGMMHEDWYKWRGHEFLDTLRSHTVCRSCQRQTTVLLLAVWRIIATVPSPSRAPR